MNNKLIDFNKQLELVRLKDKEIHNIFNSVIEENFENVKEFLKGKYDVRIVNDEEHFLKTLHFISPEKNGWSNEFDYSFEDIQGKLAFDDENNIQKELIKFILGLVR